MLDHHALFAAAESACAIVDAASWPAEVATPAKRCAADMLASLAESLDHAETSAAHRRCLRGALLKAIELASICELARAHGLGASDTLGSAGRALSLLGLSYHATSIATE